MSAFPMNATDLAAWKDECQRASDLLPILTDKHIIGRLGDLILCTVCSCVLRFDPAPLCTLCCCMLKCASTPIIVVPHR